MHPMSSLACAAIDAERHMAVERHRMRRLATAPQRRVRVWAMGSLVVAWRGSRGRSGDGRTEVPVVVWI